MSFTLSPTNKLKYLGGLKVKTFKLWKFEDFEIRKRVMKGYSICIPFYSLTWIWGKKGNTVCAVFVNEEDQLKSHKKIFIFPSLEIGLNGNRIKCNLKSQGIPLLLIKSGNMQLKYHLLSNCKLSSKRYYQDLKHNSPSSVLNSSYQFK